jgi:hypothetical protein
MSGSILFSGGSHSITRTDLNTLVFKNGLGAGYFIFGGPSSSTIMQLHNTTGNLMLQNGGTFTDNLAGLQLNHTITATAGIARGANFTSKLIASANNDVLIGLDINPTFTNTGAYTSVRYIGLRFQGIDIGRGGGGVATNTAVGSNSLYANTTGTDNTAFGTNSLLNLNAGSNNIAIGSNAGKFISGSAANLTSANNSVFIGVNSFPLADAQTNQIVIGTGSVGLGSNSTVIGSSSTTTAKIFGTLQTQGNKLSIAAKTGAYTIVATDQVLTGDATSAGFTITLPTAVSKDGQTFTIKKIDASGNAVTLGTTSSQTIDGSTTFSLPTQYKYVTVVSDGANWIIVGGN